MGIAYEKRYYGILARSITEYTHSGYLFCHTSGSVLQKFALMNLYIAVSDRGNIIDSAMECGYIDKVGVPASNLNGSSAKVVCSKLTWPIISPPP